MQRYGAENPFASEQIKIKIRNTNLKRWGTTNYTQSMDYQAHLNEIKRKAYLTRKRNNNFNTSKEEIFILKALQTCFNDVIFQYKSRKYPFACDFYIPELDLYIEYQGHASHGNCPFEKDNPEHLKIVEQWLQCAKEINFKGKPKTQYLSYVRVWTKRDPYKREIARKNNLNWIEFFNLQDFENWLNNFKKV